MISLRGPISRTRRPNFSRRFTCAVSGLFEVEVTRRKSPGQSRFPALAGPDQSHRREHFQTGFDEGKGVASVHLYKIEINFYFVKSANQLT